MTKNFSGKRYRRKQIETERIYGRSGSDGGNIDYRAAILNHNLILTGQDEDLISLLSSPISPDHLYVKGNRLYWRLY